ncbi:MAG: SMC-Scp complex subunit ScpB [Candidatus Woesearchaeota archaeon]
MASLKHKIEALLFSSGRVMSLEELRKLTKSPPYDIKEAIDELRDDLKNRNSSIMLINDSPDSWKLNVEDDHLPLVRKIVSKTELKKTLLETLAIVAWKAPVLQADIIKMRTNKAYDDLKVLEEMNYISRKKKGRTKLISLAPKFFEYFDIPPEKMKERFQKFSEMEKEIISKEEEVKQANKHLEEIKQRQDEEQENLDKLGNLDVIDIDENIKPEITVIEENQEGEKVVGDHLGDLEVYGEKIEKEIEKENRIENKISHKKNITHESIKKEIPEEKKDYKKQEDSGESHEEFGKKIKLPKKHSKPKKEEVDEFEFDAENLDEMNNDDSDDQDDSDQEGDNNKDDDKDMEITPEIDFEKKEEVEKTPEQKFQEGVDKEFEKIMDPTKDILDYEPGKDEKKDKKIEKKYKSNSERDRGREDEDV